MTSQIKDYIRLKLIGAGFVPFEDFSLGGYEGEYPAFYRIKDITIAPKKLEDSTSIQAKISVTASLFGAKPGFYDADTLDSMAASLTQDLYLDSSLEIIKAERGKIVKNMQLGRLECPLEAVFVKELKNIPDPSEPEPGPDPDPDPDPEPEPKPKYILKAETAEYVFDEMKITVGNNIEDVPLLDGNLRRLLTSGYYEDIFLKGKITLDEIFKYRNILKYLAETPRDYTLNGTTIYSVVLDSGKVTVPDGEDYALFEITLTEVYKY